MPALTGFFFTIFDLYVISVFLSKVLLGARLSVSYVFFLLLFFFSVVVSALLSPLTLESLIFCAQYFFFCLFCFLLGIYLKVIILIRRVRFITGA